MPVHRSTTTRHRQSDGTVVTTTVRQGTRRRRGEVSRYLLGDQSYSTTTTRTRYPDGTTVTNTGDTFAGAKVALAVVLIVIGLIVYALSNHYSGHSNLGGGHLVPVAGPPAPPAGYTTLLYSYDTSKAAGEDHTTMDSTLRLLGGPVVACYKATAEPGSSVNEWDVTLGSGFSAPDLYLDNPGRACTLLADAQDVSTQISYSNPTDIEVADVGGAFLVNLWEAPN